MANPITATIGVIQFKSSHITLHQSRRKWCQQPVINDVYYVAMTKEETVGRNVKGGRSGRNGHADCSQDHGWFSWPCRGPTALSEHCSAHTGKHWPAGWLGDRCTNRGARAD